MRFSLFIVLLLFPITSLADAQCIAKYGESFSFAGCKAVALPDLNIRFIDVTEPDPRVKLACWNYEASQNGVAAKISHCHTGSLGGFREFSLGKEMYIADMDVPICGQGLRQTGIVVWPKTKVKSTYTQRLVEYEKVEANCLGRAR